MSTKLKNLVTKNKSELVEMADFNSASQMKKKELMEKLADDVVTKNKSELLELNADEVKRTAEEFEVDYTTKAETLSKIIEKMEMQESNDSGQEEEETWREEFEEAIELATERCLSEGMKHNIYDSPIDPIQVAPAYMKRPKGYELLMSINITENAKEKL